MHLRRVNAVNSFEAQDVPNSDGGSGIRAVEVLAEFDKLTNMIKKEVRQSSVCISFNYL